MEPLNWLDGSADSVARRLLGCILVREIDDQILTGRIVETEAYDQTDAASHSYKGQTPRTEVMFGPSGHAYVYFTYGMHYCMNVVCGNTGEGAAVLIRALEPIAGTNVMAKLRGRKSLKELTNGPAKLCKAFNIDKDLNGHDLQSGPLRLTQSVSIRDADIVQTKRVGIAKAKDVLWRFYIRDNPFISKL